MPKPKPNESRNQYVKRAVHEMVHKEGMNPKAAVGKAEGMFTHHKKNHPKKEKK